MSEDTYTVKVWQEDGRQTWTAKLLRNGMYEDYGDGFTSRDEAVAWAAKAAENYRRARGAEASAEVVEL